MPIVQQTTIVDIQPWYRTVHLGERLISICLWLVMIKESGGHLPDNPEAWLFFVALCIAQVWGGYNSLSGANKSATPKP
jgi:hypothetical protein